MLLSPRKARITGYQCLLTNPFRSLVRLMSIVIKATYKHDKTLEDDISNPFAGPAYNNPGVWGFLPFIAVIIVVVLINVTLWTCSKNKTLCRFRYIVSFYESLGFVISCRFFLFFFFGFRVILSHR